MLQRGTRSALLLVADGATPDEARERYPSFPAETDLTALLADLEAAGVTPTRGTLKSRAGKLTTFSPTVSQLVQALALAAVGFMATRRLGGGNQNVD